MSTWVIVSWVFVAILTGINIFVFLKLKGASEQMLKMAFPGAKDMGEALGQMQKMMGGMGGMGGMAGMQNPQMQKMMQNMGKKGGSPNQGRGGFGQSQANQNPQLKAAMEMLSKANKK